NCRYRAARFLLRRLFVPPRDMKAKWRRQKVPTSFFCRGLYWAENSSSDRRASKGGDFLLANVMRSATLEHGGSAEMVFIRSLMITASLTTPRVQREQSESSFRCSDARATKASARLKPRRGSDRSRVSGG